MQECSTALRMLSLSYSLLVRLQQPGWGFRWTSLITSPDPQLLTTSHCHKNWPGGTGGVCSTYTVEREAWACRRRKP